jgi:transposase-like protein
MKCPYCQKEGQQHKAGKTTVGSQRYRCYGCKRKYTPDPKPRGHSPELRQQALQMYVDGINLRRIARHLNIHHQTVANWVKEHSENLPNPPMPKKVETAELDELFSYVGNKKTESTS